LRRTTNALGRVTLTPVGYLETGILFCADNLDRLPEFPNECVDLIYLDPPFFSNRQYEVIWGDEAEIRSFEDRWKGGIELYIEWMRDRVSHLHRVLKPTGSMYIHCDPAASHYLKVMADSIFGRSNFRNEVVWRRTGAHSKSKRWAPLHDTLLFYTRSDTYTWKYPTRPYMRGHVEDNFVHDELGWRTNYYGNVLTGSGVRGGESGKPWRGFNPTDKQRHWAIPGAVVADIEEDLSGLTQHEKLDRLYELGYIKIIPNQAWPIYERRLDPKKDGVAVGDIWSFQPYTSGTVFGTEQGIDEDVRWLSTKDRERLGYPTQKPEGLLDRIIRASSNADDIVLDPFCGCGTSVAVAEMLKRQWIGIDISPTAVNLMMRRLAKLGAVAKTEGLPKTVDDLRDLRDLEFQNWAINRVHGTHSRRKVHDMGIDGYSFMEGLPIQVKQSEKVGRPKVDEFETAMRRYGKDKGYIIAFSFSSGAYEEAARVRREGLEIALIEVATLIDVPADIAPRPGLDQLTADLLQGVRAAETELRGSRPHLAIEELVASDQGQVG
jgi:DNA modification methylase